MLSIFYKKCLHYRAAHNDNVGSPDCLDIIIE